MQKDKIIRQVIELAQKDSNILILWLYGSRAKGQFTPLSDYDFAIACKNTTPEPTLETRLQPEILALQWIQALHLKDDQLSVVDINQAPIPLALEIIRPNCVLICKDPIRLAREENRITGQSELDF